MFAADLDVKMVLTSPAFHQLTVLSASSMLTVLMTRCSVVYTLPQHQPKQRHWQGPVV